jgi:hypothetical protein
MTFLRFFGLLYVVITMVDCINGVKRTLSTPYQK